MRLATAAASLSAKCFKIWKIIAILRRHSIPTYWLYFPHERQQSNGFLRNPFFLLIFFQFLSTVQCLIAYYRLLLFLTPGTQSANFLSPESGSNKFTYQKILNKLNDYWNCKPILSDICLKKIRILETSNLKIGMHCYNCYPNLLLPSNKILCLSKKVKLHSKITKKNMACLTIKRMEKYWTL